MSIEFIKNETRSNIFFESFLKKYQINQLWIFSGFFIIIALLILGCEWRVIHTLNVEVSDFAANSLLMQDAKSFRLLVGNYSRVGFNHPGPAILYVLALGELVFYDWLHLVPSPFSGQLVMMVFYNAFWITLIFSLFKKLTHSWISAILLISLFLVILTAYVYQALISPWFPYLYILSFATFIFASANLVYGKLDTIFTLALSIGFLINGHVCFIPIISVVLIILLLFNLWISKHNINCPRVLNKDFIYKNRKKLLGASLVLFIFLFPLILETILHFPDPVLQYLSYSKSPKHHTFIESIQYLYQYWGGKMALIFGLTATGYILSSTKMHTPFLQEKINSILIALLAATIAFLIYIKFGIDDFKLTYMGFFYYSVPSLLISISFLQLFASRNFTSKNVLAFSLAILCLIATYHSIVKPILNEKDLDNETYYKKPEIINLYNSMYHLKSDSRMVLDLKTTETMWIDMVGVLLYEKRHNENFFCVNEDWRISYTIAAKCTVEEVIKAAVTGNRYTVTAENIDPILQPVLSSLGYHFYLNQKSLSPIINNVKISSIDHALFNRYVMNTGWVFYNNQTAITVGKESHLFFKVEKGFSGSIALDLEGFLPHFYSKQDVRIFANNQLITNLKLNKNKSKINLTIPVKNIDSGIIDIKFLVTNPFYLPSHWDEYRLGVFLHSFEVRKD